MKRNILTKIIILNLFFMCFFISVSNAKAEWDTTPPVLKNITFSKDVVKIGESMEVYVDAEDTDSGIESIYVAFRSPSGGGRLAVYNFDRDEKGRWVKTANIPEFSENGEWVYDYITIKDRAGNSLYIDKDWDKYSHGTFKVEGQTEVDTTPPVLKNITFSKDVVKIGESMEVYVDAEDTDSGIESIYVAFRSPSGGGRLAVYNFDRDEKGRWVKTANIPEFSESGEWVYDYITIKDRAGNSLYIDKDWDKYSRGTFKVNGQVNQVELTRDVETPKLGQAITFTAKATGSSQPVYQFWVREDGNWRMAQNYSKTNEFKYTPNKNGDYNVSVYAKEAGSKAQQEAMQAHSFKVKPLEKVTAVELNRDIVAPKLDQTITFTAKATGSSQPVYQFWVKEDGNWRIAQNYSKTNVFKYKPSKNGSYNVSVYAKDADAKTNQEAIKVNDFTIKTSEKVTAVELNRDIEIPKIGQAITFTAKATGSSQPVYQFWVKEDGNWRIAQNYSKTNEFKYTPNKNGSYNVSVYAKDADAKTNQEAIKVNDFTIKTSEKVTAVELSRDIEAPKSGQAITFTAKATGSSQPVYQFWVKEDGNWRIAQNYSKTNEFKYTPNKNGSYNVSVYAKDVDSKEIQESFTSQGIIIK
ncbi:triple tyrosine motif-containing protein [Bacillus cereus]|nr:triple tyrosine motif-containing protein [Bacillus cereus]MEB9988127.1 triple tyrosine motif-containing protein [Bacillus cereus]MEC3110283.1 triple tyrosine motif-containing protein [Bacillus cereus]